MARQEEHKLISLESVLFGDEHGYEADHDRKLMTVHDTDRPVFISSPCSGSEQSLSLVTVTWHTPLPETWHPTPFHS